MHVEPQNRIHKGVTGLPLLQGIYDAQCLTIQNKTSKTLWWHNIKHQNANNTQCWWGYGATGSGIDAIWSNVAESHKATHSLSCESLVFPKQTENMSMWRFYNLHVNIYRSLIYKCQNEDVFSRLDKLW